MSSAMSEPGRLLVGHPFNPPHVIPLVEVVPGEHSTSAATTAAVDFYRALGKRPVLLQKEIGGFVGNRLQAAVVQESVHLVEAGVVSLEDLDTVVTESLGPRWATVGPFEGLHLGGGPGGLRHLLEHLGPGMQRRWKDLGHPELTPETIKRLSQSSEERFAALPYEQHAEQRFREQLAVLGARANGNGDPRPRPSPSCRCSAATSTVTSTCCPSPTARCCSACASSSSARSPRWSTTTGGAPSSRTS
jgi:ketoreductase RED1